MRHTDLEVWVKTVDREARTSLIKTLRIELESKSPGEDPEIYAKMKEHLKILLRTTVVASEPPPLEMGRDSTSSSTAVVE